MGVPPIPVEGPVRTVGHMTRPTAKPELTTDFQRRMWPVVDVYARIERAAARATASQAAARRGSAA